MKNITPASLWKNFNPAAEDLQPRLVNRLVKEGVVFEYSYITGRTVGKTKTRVACLLAYPEDVGRRKLPLIVICDLSQNIDEEAAWYWAQNGFVAVAVDYKGSSRADAVAATETPREVFGTFNDFFDESVDVSVGNSGLTTIYPVDMEYCNLAVAEQNFRNVERGATGTCWYEWTLNTRRAITFALNSGFVDERKIGVYGVRLGNIVALQVLAMDNRVAAGAELYATQLEAQSRSNDEDSIEYGSDLLDFIDRSEKLDVWDASVSPMSYINYITKPFYTLVGTNSANVNINRTMKLLSRMNNENQGIAVFAPRLMDSAPVKYRDNLYTWFRNVFDGKTLRNDAVSLNPISERGRIRIEGKRLINQGGGIVDAELYYSRCRRSANSAHNWVRAARVGSEDDLKFSLDIFDKNTPVRAFLNVTCKNGITLSFNMPEFIPARLGEVSLCSKTKIIFCGEENHEFVSMNHTGRQASRFVDAHPVKNAEGAYGIRGVSGTCLGTFALSDDRILRDEQSLLSMDVFSRQSQNLNVFLLYNWGEKTQAVYAKTLKLVGGQIWQKILLDYEDFKSVENGRPLKPDELPCGICFEAESEIILTNLLYT